MSPETRAPRITLRVTVQPGGTPPLHPATVTLNNKVVAVVWHADGLPPGDTLEITFAGDHRGPFFALESRGSEVIGQGNRGPQDTLREYAYTAAVHRSTGVVPVGPGELKNRATHVVEPMSVDPPGGPPLT